MNYLKNIQKTTKASLEPYNSILYIYNHYYTWLTDMAISMFTWINLPEGCNERALESALFYQGRAVFFKNDLPDLFLALPCIDFGSYDIYGNPNVVRARSDFNSFTKDLTVSDINLGKPNYGKGNSEGVIIYNNITRMGDAEKANYYAYQIAQIKMSIDSNVRVQKFPFIVNCEKKQKLTMENMYKEIVNNTPVIYKDANSSDSEGINILKTDVEFKANEMYIYYEKLLQEAFAYFGITESNNKKERMITSEVMMGLGDVEANRHIRLKTRKEACKLINEKFGLNIDVQFRDDIDRAQDEYNYNIEDNMNNNNDNNDDENNDKDGDNYE